ncbi:hypothetical protein PRIPAC_80790 [Pristionchus pacificus]|uniref:Uncharacterized protein n=1 Tax=Pristionchus pacificus TaxID=54126 RepID=A0A2A6CKF4_PRIPA|nr:hypothetical protein PRIPAC_80790 [Pristionchus pacificus]|eukprot:PDM78705.1 hypothetical protein PRIPAC_31284 [Pristionchus pacificus]
MHDPEAAAVTEALIVATTHHAEATPETPEKCKKSWWQRADEDLKGDRASIALLLFLYLLQGVPLGLIGAIPLVLQERGISLGQQAVFSLAYWPFSLKLLWAPLVDSIYWKVMGKRKSWLIPCQYLIGIFMLVLSYKVNAIMGDPKGEHGPDVTFLMMIFLPLNFLAATQDIAVDGWALTILSRKNVGYASTCNAIGQTAGSFLGNVVFLALESAHFANKFRAVPQERGFVDLAEFVFFWGCIFVVATTLVWIFKKEVDNKDEAEVKQEEAQEVEELELGIIETYSMLWRILALKPMIWMLVIYLTGKFAFAATDGVTSFRLIRMGMPKETLASFGLFRTIIQLILPVVISRWTAGPRPLNAFLWAYPARILICIGFAVLVYVSPSLRMPDSKEFYYTFYIIWAVAYMIRQIGMSSMFVATTAFNAQISDPLIGGTYMTLLNTINNLGGNWPVTLILSITDLFTWKNCNAPAVSYNGTALLYSCSSAAAAAQCAADGGICDIYIDGYYFGVALCSIVGLVWYKLLFSKVKYIQEVPKEEWRIVKKTQ